MRRVGWALAVVVVLAACLYGVGGLEIGAIEREYPPVGTFVDVPGGRLQVLDLGKDKAASGTLVLLHGATSNLEEMALGLGRALAARYRVVVFDRPGHGWSARPGGAADAAPERQAALIAAALERMDIGKAVIVGHSLGAAVALAMALDQPGHVGGLVLIAPAAEPDLGAALAWYDRAGVASLFANAAFDRTAVVPLGLLMTPVIAAAVFAPSAVPAGFIHAAAIPLMLRPDQLRADAADLAALGAFARRAAPRYGTIRVPTLVITGDADRVVSPQRQAHVLAAAIPGARLVVVPGAGHLPQYADPARVQAEIGALVGEAAAPPAAAEGLRGAP
jgi:pimeloyl-ACP methyl ester carboxylesterase